MFDARMVYSRSLLIEKILAALVATKKRTPAPLRIQMLEPLANRSLPYSFDPGWAENRAQGLMIPIEFA
jgi:hypothetical protein